MPDHFPPEQLGDRNIEGFRDRATDGEVQWRVTVWHANGEAHKERHYLVIGDSFHCYCESPKGSKFRYQPDKVSPKVDDTDRLAVHQAIEKWSVM